MRTYKFQVEITCHNDQGQPDLERAEEMLGLCLQELIYDDEFVTALAEDTAVQIDVVKIS